MVKLTGRNWKAFVVVVVKKKKEIISLLFRDDKRKYIKEVAESFNSCFFFSFLNGFFK